MGIFCRGEFRGQSGKIEALALLNTGSDYVILPRRMAELISPKPVGEEEFEEANGSRARRRVNEIEVEVEDYAGKKRSCRTLTTIEERMDLPSGSG